METALNVVVSVASAVLLATVTPTLLLVLAVLYIAREIVYKPTIVDQLPFPALREPQTETELKTKDVSSRVCVVTGAAGFFGKILVKRLIETNDYDEIRAVDLAPIKITHPTVKYFSANVLDQDALTKAIRGAGVVYHIAATVDLGYYFYTRANVININTVGTINVINCCLSEGVRALVYTSSVAAVTDDVSRHHWDEQAFEDVPVLSPNTTYGVSKRLSESYLRAANGRGVLRTIALRPFEIYGPQQVNFNSDIMLDDTLPTRDGPVNMRCYVKNLAHWHHLGAKKILESPEGPWCGSAYFVGDAVDAYMTPKEFLNLAIKHRKQPPKKITSSNITAFSAIFLVLAFINYLTACKIKAISMLSPALVIFMKWEAACDISKGVRDLGYVPLFTTEEAMQDWANSLA